MTYQHLPERARTPSLAARALLRALLRGAAGLRHLATAPIARREQGALWLPAAPHVGISVSHSANQVMAAVAEGSSVGVDIERVDPAFDGQSLARRFFHPSEVARLAEHPQGFFSCWTAKEAVLKCLQTGLRTPLSSFCIDDFAQAHRVSVGGQSIWVQPLPGPPGYKAAIAWARLGSRDHAKHRNQSTCKDLR